MSTSFEALGLRAELVRAVADKGYTVPTPIQAQAIPVVLAGRDLLGAAQTGTGKTAGFTLPLIQNLSAKANASHSPARHPVRALILTPTRELAAQVEESVRTYGKFSGLKSSLVYGGVGMQPQVDALRRGVDILVATPGRLLDHVQQKTVDLRQVEILVLDEADRMLDMGFIHDIRKILALLPTQRQNLLFSATFPDEIRKLAGSFMKDPATVEVARRNTPAELVAQVAHPVDAGRKRELLAHLIKSGDWRQVLVFCKTKHGANRLAQQLEREGIEADAIHGNKSQNARTRALKLFKDNELRVLVATDIAARGLDIEALPHVVNYDMPHVAEDYVHRIGRTGRAGAEGEAVSLISHEDRPLLAAIERLMNRKVEQKVIEGFEPGTASSRPPEEKEKRFQGQGRPRQQQQPRRNQPPRHQPRPQQSRPQQPRPQHSRPQQQPRPQHTDSAYEDQIREARARMREEGESVPETPIQAPHRPGNGNGNVAGRPEGGRRRNRGGRGRNAGGPNRGNSQGGNARGGQPFRSAARSSRQQQWDPRKEKAYSEPRDYAQPAASQKPVHITHKPKRTLVGFVGALLGRKKDEEKS
ncbi:MAG TPA: DEAD/DEAH box helicase [Burkholderiales bacterium]|nr:DEAD/DEAH box helicase [Burkholderiales bacterium]